MTAHRNKIMLLIFFIQLLIPLSCIALVCTVLARGQEVTVRMAAYDPYDMIRGRFLQLRFPDSEDPYKSGLEYVYNNWLYTGKMLPDMYVVLEPAPDTGLSRFSFATMERPPHGTPYISCPVSSYTVVLRETDGMKLRINPRIDKYYLNEADASFLDDSIQWDTDILVRLKLWNGIYAVNGLEVDGVSY